MSVALLPLLAVLALRSAVHSDTGPTDAALEIRKAYFEQTPKGKSTPQEAERWDALVAATCPLDWAPEVKTQLANWKKTGITLDMLDKYCVRKTLRVSVVDNVIRAAHWSFSSVGAARAVCFLWLVQMAILRAQAAGRDFPDVDFVLQTGDGAQSTVTEMYQWDNPGPLFGSVKCGSDASVAVPMSLHDQFGAYGSGAMSLKMYAGATDRLTKWDSVDWEDKQDKLFFSAGSHPGKKAAFRRGFRKQLLDIKSPLFHTVYEELEMTESSKYRYLVYAYGRCGWSRRIHELAFFHATVFLEASNCTEFFMPKFEAMVDHIPVKEDFSDLQVKVEAMHKRPQDTRRYADAWRKKGRQVFALECVLDYIELLFTEYATLQRFKPQLRSKWPSYDLTDNIVFTPAYLGQPEMRRPMSECAADKSFWAGKTRGRSKITC
jgi:hypothetical protein